MSNSTLEYDVDSLTVRFCRFQEWHGGCMDRMFL
jgi:hypothetical protein